MGIDIRAQRFTQKISYQTVFFIILSIVGTTLNLLTFTLTAFEVPSCAIIFYFFASELILVIRCMLKYLKCLQFVYSSSRSSGSQLTLQENRSYKKQHVFVIIQREADNCLTTLRLLAEHQNSRAYLIIMSTQKISHIIETDDIQNYISPSLRNQFKGVQYFQFSLSSQILKGNLATSTQKLQHLFQKYQLLKQQIVVTVIQNGTLISELYIREVDKKTESSLKNTIIYYFPVLKVRNQDGHIINNLFEIYSSFCNFTQVSSSKGYIPEINISICCKNMKKNMNDGHSESLYNTNKPQMVVIQPIYIFSKMYSERVEKPQMSYRDSLQQILNICLQNLAYICSIIFLIFQLCHKLSPFAILKPYFIDEQLLCFAIILSLILQSISFLIFMYCRLETQYNLFKRTQFKLFIIQSILAVTIFPIRIIFNVAIHVLKCFRFLKEKQKSVTNSMI